MKKIIFSNYEWSVKHTEESKVGPGPNFFSSGDDAVYLDNGGLHLKTIIKEDKHYSSEVVLEKTLGYGRYFFQVEGPVYSLDTTTVFGAFLYRNDEEEVDIEFSNSMVGESLGQYVIQPARVRGNLFKFDMPKVDQNSFDITWSENSIKFRSWKGFLENPTDETSISNWVNNKKVISNPEETRMIFNLWFYKGKRAKKMEEVVIKKFIFDPETKTII